VARGEPGARRKARSPSVEPCHRTASTRSNGDAAGRTTTLQVHVAPVEVRGPQSRASMCRRSVALEGLHVLLRNRLLLKPGGYEGVRNMEIAFAPNDLPAANSKPERHPSGSARPAVPRLRPGYRDRDHFGTFVTHRLDLDGESARSRVLVTPIRAKTVVSPIGIYPLRRAVELGHPRAAGIPAGKPAFEIPIVPGGQSLTSDLDVLLRHRPRSISRSIASTAFHAKRNSVARYRFGTDHSSNASDRP
jgi:hypothetical protein